MKSLQRYNRIAIVGGPRTGKTTLSKKFEGQWDVICTDAWKHLPWHLQPVKITEACQGSERFVLEGVQAARVLRRGLEVDLVVFLDAPHVPLSGKQESMTKGIKTIFSQWRETNPEIRVVERS